MNSYLRMILSAAVLLATAWSAPAAAQTVYRCGNSYSQEPCVGGKALDASDARSAAQKAQTDQATKRDASAAQAMEKARTKDEAKPAPVGMPLAKPEEKPEPVPKTVVKKKPKAKGKQLEHFTAVAPKAPVEKDSAKKK